MIVSGLLNFLLRRVFVAFVVVRLLLMMMMVLGVCVMVGFFVSDVVVGQCEEFLM